MDALRTRAAWQKLQRQATEGDELWAFSSPSRKSKRESRYSGYALVRDGKVLQNSIVVLD
jgi:hypothetical protein